MQRHATATLIALFQPFNSVTGGSSDTNTSASSMCSHKSSIYISFFSQEKHKPYLECTLWNIAVPEVPAGVM